MNKPPLHNWIYLSMEHLDAGDIMQDLPILRKEKSVNENILAGIQCPECQSDGPFRIEAKALFLAHDDGTEVAGDVEWDDDSHCECAECGQSGALSGFRLPEEDVTGVHEFSDGADQYQAIYQGEGIYRVNTKQPDALGGHVWVMQGLVRLWGEFSEEAILDELYGDD